MQLPLIERKGMLEALLTPAPPSVPFMGHFTGQGDWLFEQAVAQKLEGVVAKRASSAYVPGTRSLDRVKRKRPGAVPAQRFRREPR